MKTKHDFPPYLGFGILDRQSIRQEGEWLLANYTLNKLNILEVALSDEKAIYTDIWDGIKTSYSEYPTLKEAYENHYRFINYPRSPVFKYMLELVCHKANIYFVIPDHKESQVMFFPALLLMRFRIPLKDNLLMQAGALIKQYPFRALVHNLYPSELYITKLNGTLEKTDIHILELITPMAKAYELAQLLSHHGIIHREKHLRVILQAWSDERDELRYFPGKETDSWKNYGILLKGKTNMTIDK